MRKTIFTIALVTLLPVALTAQDSTKTKIDSTKPTEKGATTPSPAATIAVPINFSGVVFGNYQYQGAKGASNDQNKFELERAYLTFRMPAGDRASIRVTGDVYQQTSGTCNATTVTTPTGTTTVPCTPSDAYYRGWVLRAKYAYLQYDFLQAKKPADWGIVARIGLIHTMFIDHEENFWPRWLSQTPVERAGFFSSADGGIATILSLPNKWGEAYAAVTNGPGYSSRETDRFKDYQARLTITPLTGSDISYLKTLAIDGWVYRGTLASKFVAGGTGQTGPVNGGIDRNRWGIFAGIRDPRLTIGADYANRTDGGETGANTTASARAVSDSTGRLIAAYAVLKPFQMANSKSKLPLGIVGRFDQIKPNTGNDAHYNIVIGGLSWDLNKKTAISLDYQEQTPHGLPSTATTKTYYMHWVANF